MTATTRRRWRIILIVLAVFYAGYRLTFHWLVEAKLTEIRRQGYPATLVELNNWYSQVPKDENAAEVYQRAFASFDNWNTNKFTVLRPNSPARQWGRAQTNTLPALVPVTVSKRELLPFFGQEKLPAHAAALSNDMRTLVAEYLADNSEPLELLHQATTIPACRFPLDLTKGFETPLPHLNSLRQSARLLALEAVLHSEIGDGRKAAAAIRAGYGVARSLDREPSVISQLVRDACLSIVTRGLERTLNRTTLPDEALEQLTGIVHEAETSLSMARGMHGESCFITGVAQIPLHKWPAFLDAELAGRWKPFIIPIVAAYRMAGLMDIDHLNCLRIMNQYNDAWQAPLPARLKAGQSYDASMNTLPHYFLLSRMVLPGLANAIQKDAMTVTRLRTVQAALVVERYRLANNKLPDNLSGCLPTSVPVNFTDPLDGQPLRYKKLAKGFIVYSVGKDCTDDGGDENKDITFVVER